MKKILIKSFLIWLPFAALITFTCLLTDLLVQQSIRQAANDPQIQLAEDISEALSTGAATPDQIIPPGQIMDISASLDPYIILYDSTGAPLASSASLNGQTPTLPPGVFASVRQQGEDRITWQPQNGVRGAVIVDSFSGNASSSGGFVLVGRSLREVEVREDNILHLALLAWLAGLVGMFAVIWAAVWAYKKKEKEMI
jgi:hypothetical protein